MLNLAQISLPLLFLAAQSLAAPAWKRQENSETELRPNVHIKPFVDQSKCLALHVEDNSRESSLLLVDCDGADLRASWRLPNEQTPSLIYSASRQLLCLDGGDGAQVTAAECNLSNSNRSWWYGGAEDQHIAVTEQGRCLDLKDGNVNNGGWIQTYPCEGWNDNQKWIVEPIQ